MIKVSDLTDQTWANNRTVLYCDCCGARASANKGDYFNLPNEHVFRCCNGPMRLAIPITYYRTVKR